MLNLLGAAIGAGVGALNKAISNKLDSISQINTYKKKAAIDYGYTQKVAADNDKYQRDLIVDKASLEKVGMQNAGLSVASLNGGGFQNTSSNAAMAAPSGALPTQSSPDVMSGVLQLLNGFVLDKTVEKLSHEIQNIDEDTENKRADTDNKDAVTTGINLDNTKKQWLLEDEDALSKLRNDFVFNVFASKYGPEDNANITAPRSYKYMSQERMLAILGGNSTKVQQQDAENAKAMADTQQYVHEFNVYKLFNDNPESAQAVVDMTFANRDLLNEELRKLRNDNDLFEKCRQFYELAAQLDVLKTRSEIVKNYAEATQLKELAKHYSDEMQSIWKRLEIDGNLAQLDGALKLLDIKGHKNALQFDFENIMSDWINNGNLRKKALLVCLIGGAGKALQNAVPAAIGAGVGAGVGRTRNVTVTHTRK